MKNFIYLGNELRTDNLALYRTGTFLVGDEVVTAGVLRETGDFGVDTRFN